MYIPTILPPIGAPVSTDVLNLEALKDASIGEILNAYAVLANIAAERFADPDSYHEVATYTDAQGADWSGFQAEAEQGGVVDETETTVENSEKPLPALPVAPDNYCDTLPAMGQLLSQISRFQEASLAHYSRYLEVGLKNQRMYLGTPYKDGHFKDPTQYLVETMRISRHAARKIVSRGQYFAHRPGGMHGDKAGQPVFQELANSLVAGRLPIENADRFITLDEDLTKYSNKTHQPLERKEEALQAFEPTLVEAGEAATPDELSKSKQRWLNHIAHWVCPDGPSPAEAIAKEPDNELRMREHADGSATYSMHVSSEASIVMKNFMLHQLNFNGTPVRIPKRVLKLLKIFKDAKADRTAPEQSDAPLPTESGPHQQSRDLAEGNEAPPHERAETGRVVPAPPEHRPESNRDEENLGEILGPLNTWDTQLDPNEIIAENSAGEPIRASHIDLLDHLNTGQRMGAILVSLMYNMVTLDPAVLGAKKAHGSLARLNIVQDIETAHHTLGIEKIPPEARRPHGPEGFKPPVIKRCNPDGPDPSATDALSSGPHDVPQPDATGPPEKVAWTPYQSEAINIGPIHPDNAAIFACNSELAGQIWDGPDTVLQEKRSKRFFTVAQRRVILARDKGCQAPGCTVPAVHCAIHHIKEWTDGGPTDEKNAVTLCPRHHAAVHKGKWEIRRHDGLIFFQPAPWLDPSQPLLRNIYWNI